MCGCAPPATHPPLASPAPRRAARRRPFAITSPAAIPTPSPLAALAAPCPQDKDPAGWWAETFLTHHDSKPKGPEAISLDIEFPSARHVYGIPEHATDLALRPTAGEGVASEPYRWGGFWWGRGDCGEAVWAGSTQGWDGGGEGGGDGGKDMVWGEPERVGWRRLTLGFQAAAGGAERRIVEVRSSL
jgi:hypothetical protein